MAECTSLVNMEAPMPMRWIVPEILPMGELVLLDGATGVGKSAFAAHLAAQASRQQFGESIKHVLYISSIFQTDIRNNHLRAQKAKLENIHEINYDCRPHLDRLRDGQGDKHLLNDFNQFLKQTIDENRPALVIVDSLDELLQFAEEPDATAWRWFFREMILFCMTRGCTIVLPRLHGTHEGRYYGAGTRIGTEFARHIVSLHWHPHDSNKRVLTIAKCLKFEMGKQWHIHIMPDNGEMFTLLMDSCQHVRPAKSPQTWLADPEHLHETEEICIHVENKMAGARMKKKELMQYIVELGYSQRAFLRSMSKAKLSTARDGVDWYYYPTFRKTWRTGAEVVRVREDEPRAAAAEMDTVELKQAG